MTGMFDVSAIAAVAGLRDTRGHVPLDACVPQRTTRALPSGDDRLDVTELFVLFHVDGETSVKDIAHVTALSLPTTIEITYRFLALGLVELPV
jgi:hypothetical protein